MRFLVTEKKYVKLTKYYQNMSNIKKRTERAHYKFIIDVYPEFGIYLTLFALIVDKIFSDAIPSEIVAKVSVLIVIVVLALLIGIQVRDASVHISAIDDTEKEIKIKS